MLKSQLDVNISLKKPKGIAIEDGGNIYIADSDNHRIRKVDTKGKITTVAGTGTAGFSGDAGAANQARLRYPEGVAIDLAGNIYIADTNNHRIRIASLVALNPVSVKLDSIFISNDSENSLYMSKDGTSQLLLKNGLKKFFNTKGLQTSVVERNGNTYSYQYDMNDNLTSIVDPAIMETRLEYIDGHIQTITTPDGKITVFQHDADGNLISITDPAEGAISYFYYARHLLISKTGPDGHITTYNYNAYGQVVSVASFSICFDQLILWLDVQHNCQRSCYFQHCYVRKLSNLLGKSFLCNGAYLKSICYRKFIQTTVCISLQSNHPRCNRIMRFPLCNRHNHFKR